MFSFLGSFEFTLDVILVQALLVLSLFVVFQVGLLSLASVGFMAVGAYTTTILTLEHGVPVGAGVALGTLAGAICALAFGLPILRLKGIYLALGSLALAQALVIGIANFGFTNGAQGFVGVPLTTTTAQLLIVLGVAVVGLQLLHRSFAGRATRALRLDERTAEGLGIHATRYKVCAFVASGALAGLAGALEAHLTGVISPDQYSFDLLVVALTYVVVGGSGHWVGPLLATLVLGLGREQLGLGGSSLEDYVFGGLLIAVMIVAPNGLSDHRLWRSVRTRLGRRRVPAVVPASPAPTAPASTGVRS